MARTNTPDTLAQLKWFFLSNQEFFKNYSFTQQNDENSETWETWGT